jgi:hypothetical protein
MFFYRRTAVKVKKKRDILNRIIFNKREILKFRNQDSDGLESTLTPPEWCA